jgi:hypothetical protein
MQIDKREAFALLQHTFLTTTVWQLRGMAVNKQGSMCASFLCAETLKKTYGIDQVIFPYGTVINVNVQTLLVHLNDRAKLTFEQIGALFRDGTIHPELTTDEYYAINARFPFVPEHLSDDLFD